jgi:hypothetical protein
MHSKDAIQHTYGFGDFILNTYLGDLTDADLLVRPVPGQNHIAWQLGHLIVSERSMLESIKSGASPALPEGFEEAHNKEATTSDDPAQFATRQRYLELYQAQRAATRKVLDEIGEADLDAPAPERFRRMCPTAGTMFALIGNHVLMHVGQFVSVRRKLNKPVTV